MVFTYTELGYEDNKDWLDAEIVNEHLKPIHTMVVDAVFHDLNNEYSKRQGDCTDFDKDAQFTYWCGNHFYVEDEVFRVLIDGKYYVAKYLYVTTKENVVLVAVKPKDIWKDDSDLVDEIDELEDIYFLVEE